MACSNLKCLGEKIVSQLQNEVEVVLKKCLTSGNTAYSVEKNACLWLHPPKLLIGGSNKILSRKPLSRHAVIAMTSGQMMWDAEFWLLWAISMHLMERIFAYLIPDFCYSVEEILTNPSLAFLGLHLELILKGIHSSCEGILGPWSSLFRGRNCSDPFLWLFSAVLRSSSLKEFIQVLKRSLRGEAPSMLPWIRDQGSKDKASHLRDSLTAGKNSFKDELQMQLEKRTWRMD